MFGVIFGEKIPARITRKPLSTGNYTQVLPNPPTIPTFTVRRFMGNILQPINPYYANTEMFQLPIYQVRLVFADWPQGVVSDFPVKQGDNIIIPVSTDSNGNATYSSYNILGVEPFTGGKIQIYVGVVPLGNQGP